jgi:hypothetical protein
VFVQIGLDADFSSANWTAMGFLSCMDRCVFLCFKEYVRLEWFSDVKEIYNNSFVVAL